MPLTSEQASLQVQDLLFKLQDLVHKTENERRKGEATINSIEKIDEKAPISQHKLKNLYKTGLLEAAKEEALIREALSKIHEIRNIRNERRLQARNAGNKEVTRKGALIKMLQDAAQTLPLFVSKSGEKVPPLCGATPAESSYVAKPGDMVAALAKIQDDSNENWILAEVVQYSHHSGKYEVDDIDEEQKDRHVLSKRRIVPLPLMRVNPETDGHALFPKKTTVMALFPQTTCFYQAVIDELPKSGDDEYRVSFADTTFSSGYSPPLKVAQRYVISIKQSKKSSNA